MFALFKKEIRYFFTSPIGFTTIGLFILLNGLFLWILKTDYNIFDSGFADLLPFFRFSSWIFIFLIPALTMRTISEEKRSGMLSILFTKPITIFQFVFGKFLGILTLIFIILIPSFLYIYIVWQLGNPTGNLDIATTIGSYIALFLLAGAFAAIGIWASSLSSNQIIAFLLASFVCFFLFFGLDQIAELLFSDSVSQIGLQSHFQAISRGVIDTQNVIYFLSVIGLFLYLTISLLSTYKL